LLESHISYSLLCYFRSQHDNQSWLAALTAVLDASALLMTAVEGGCARQAQLTFSMARHAIVDLVQVFGFPPNTEIPAGGSRLSSESLDRLLRMLASSGVPLSRAADARERLMLLTEMYEGQVQAMSRYLRMPLPPFLSLETKRDTWMKVAALRRPSRAEDSPCAEQDRHPHVSREAQAEEPHLF
jgi:hypothetical protein